MAEGYQVLGLGAWRGPLATLGSMPRARTRQRARSRPCRVLLVEDDDAFAAALTELLEAGGRAKVAGRASDGREGVELADALCRRRVDGHRAPGDGRRRGDARDPAQAADDACCRDHRLEYKERALEVREAGAVDFVRKGRLDPDLVEIVLAAAKRRSVAGAAERAADTSLRRGYMRARVRRWNQSSVQ